MYINFQHNRFSRSVKGVHINLFAKNHKLHKFATTNSNFKKQTSQICIIVKRTCISIFSKIGLVNQSNQCTQINLPKNRKLHKLQLPIAIF